ncbi:MAG TPA: hypothetical protein VF928_15075 [Usitatibacteraceae bacterium]
MKTQTKVDTTLFTMIIATLVTGVCFSGAGNLLNSENARPDAVASKTIATKQL